jgi:hypothetical protein
VSDDKRVEALEAALRGVIASLDDATIVHCASKSEVGWALEAFRTVPTGRERVKALVRFALVFEP